MNAQTKLYDLPDDVVDRCDGELYELVQAAGYSQNVRALVNDWNAWGMTVEEFKTQLSEQTDA